MLLFGWDKVSRGFHFFATCMVALGSIFSSVWIVVANSWQQTPAGSHLVEREINGHVFQRAEIVDFWAMVFNPSTVHRLVHVWLGAFILGAFFVMSISAWYLLKGRHTEFAKRSFTGGLLLGMLASLGQLAVRPLQLRNGGPASNRPSWRPSKGISKRATAARPCTCSAGRTKRRRTVKAGVAIPGMLSFLVHQDFEQARARAGSTGSGLRQPAGLASRFRRIT